MAQVLIMNDIFWNSFHSRIIDIPQKVSVRVNHLNLSIEDIISDYKANNNANRTYHLVKQLEKVFQTLFDNISADQLEGNEVEMLTDICRRFNEDFVIQEIIELATEERHAQEDIKIIPLLHKEKISRFAAENFPYGSHRKSQSGTPKKGEDVEPWENQKNKKAEAIVPKAATPSNHKSDRQKIGRQHSVKSILKPNEEIKPTFKINPLEKIQTPTTPTTNSESLKIKQEIKNLISVIQEDLRESKIDTAYNNYLNLRDFSKTRNLEKKDLAFYNEIMEENKEMLNDVQYFKKEADVILRELQDDEGYILEGVKKNFNIKYKLVEGEGVSLKMEGEVDVPMFNMIALIYEMQGYTNWMPFCKDAKEVKHISRASKAGWIKFNLPPPIFDREAYVYGVGFDRININGSVLIAAKSIHDDEIVPLKYDINIPGQSKTTRMDLKYMGGEFYPISKNKIRLNLVTKLDPKIKYIPLSLINWVVRKAASFLLDRLLKKATNLKGTLWEKKILENREFYGWLEEKMEEYLGAEATQQQ